MAARGSKMAPTGSKMATSPEPLKLGTWDPQKVTTVIRILHLFTYEAMSKQGSKVGRLKDR